MTKIFLRVFVHATPDESAAVADALSAALADLAATASVESVRPYWKIDGYQEVCLTVTTPGSANVAVGLLAGRLGERWKWFGEQEAIWDPPGGAGAIDSRIRWMHIEAAE